MNKWQCKNLGRFSYGVTQAQHCHLRRIAAVVAEDQQPASVERQLQRFISNQQIEMEKFFEEWTRWIMEAVEIEEIVLLVDETKIRDHLGVMMVGLAYESRCIPLAWKCYEANSKAGYPAEGQVGIIRDLLQAIHPALGERCPLVQADRGIGTSPKLIAEMNQLGWRYLFRVTKMSKIVTDDAEYVIYNMVEKGETWHQAGKIFKRRGKIPAFACAVWGEDYEEPLALVTNDPDLTGWEYAQRNWQEQSFRDLKSNGWQWHMSHVWKPTHAERLLMILCVAYAWVIALGSSIVQAGLGRAGRMKNGILTRHRSLFQEGLSHLRVLFRNSLSIPTTFRFLPDTRFT